MAVVIAVGAPPALAKDKDPCPIGSAAPFERSRAFPGAEALGEEL